MIKNKHLNFIKGFKVFYLYFENVHFRKYFSIYILLKLKLYVTITQ